MAAEPTLTWDIDPVDGGARRPTLNDLGGADFQDDEDYPPPRDGSEPYADEYNATKRTAAAVARVVPNAIVTVDFAAGTPFIDKLMTASAELVSGDFVLVDTGTGETKITWTTGALPEIVCDPMVSTNGGGDNYADAVVVAPNEIAIFTFAAGVAADVRFTVAIY